MKRISLAMMGIVMMITALKAGNVGIPDCALSSSIAPYVDNDGYVNPVIGLGNIAFGEGLTLPLTLNFSSTVRPPSPEFGQGWECPLFESKIYDVQKDLKQVELLGGRRIYLVYNQRTDTWKHYFSDSWKGVAKGDDFELTYQSGVKFTFNKGLISSLIMPDGRTILWNRLGDKLVSLNESGKSPAIELTYDKLGFAHQILYNPDSLGVAKAVCHFDVDLIYAGIGKIVYPEGRTIVFTRKRDKSLNPVLSLTDTKRPPITVSWDVHTGKIISDDRYTYRITEVSDDETYPKMSRINKFTGKMESYFYNEKRGTTDITMADGTICHTEVIQSPGPTYHMTRLVQETKNGKTQTVLRRSFDDAGHLLLEATGLAGGKELVKQYAYDDTGRIVSYLWNGKEMWKNVYDPITGQLKERDLPNLGVTLAFDPLPGGEIKESIEKTGGIVTKIKTLTPSDYQKKVTLMQQIE